MSSICKEKETDQKDAVLGLYLKKLHESLDVLLDYFFLTMNLHLKFASKQDLTVGLRPQWSNQCDQK